MKYNLFQIKAEICFFDNCIEFEFELTLDYLARFINGLEIWQYWLTTKKPDLNFWDCLDRGFKYCLTVETLF